LFLFFLYFFFLFMNSVVYFFFFFFSSRRRHTRYIGDWSSDVCSSDLEAVSSHVADRKKEAEKAEAIVNGEVEKFQARLQTLDVVPTIVSLQDHLETIRQAEIDRVRGRLGSMTTDQ